MNQDSSGRTIRPADFQSPENRNDNPDSKVVSTTPISVKAVAVVSALLLIALATLFLLPGQISVPDQDIASDSTEALENRPPDEQPFVDAQLLRARQDAQDILASLLSTQDQLEALEVTTWAADRYDDVMTLAASGDAAYQQREFDQALTIYRQAEQQASDLLAEKDVYAQEALAAAGLAFQNNDGAAALEKYQLALLLMPESQEAQQGVERSTVLDEVNELKASAVRASADSEWNRAVELLEQAADLDPMDTEVAELLAQAEEEVRQISFRQALAEGFNALADADYSAARSAFMRADRLVPDNPTVADALLQVESAAETGQRGELMDQALAAESREDWDLAAMHYQDLLERDESNLNARVSLVRVEARAELDNKIKSILENPTALQDDERWNEAETTLADARAVLNKTSRLVQQIDDLERVIQQARTPVELQILSDGATRIEIYRVGRLGTLTDHRVNIYPGEYILIGRRSGYRDVRKELDIPGGTEAISIRIEANEPI